MNKLQEYKKELAIQKDIEEVIAELLKATSATYSISPKLEIDSGSSNLQFVYALGIINSKIQATKELGIVNSYHLHKTEFITFYKNVIKLSEYRTFAREQDKLLDLMYDILSDEDRIILHKEKMSANPLNKPQ